MDAVLNRSARTYGGDRPPAVAGAFYPADRDQLRAMVADLLDEVTGPPPFAGLPAGILVPHAGLVYSGAVAACAWRLLAARGSEAAAATPGATAPGTVPATTAPGATITGPPTVVILGTNHGAAWVDGIGAWPSGSWQMPLGEVAVDAAIARAILDLGPPFVADPDVHAAEHSIEVRSPIAWAVEPGLRIVPLAVSTGIGREAIAAGERLGALLRTRHAAGERIVLAISTDMAHYPDALVCDDVTRRLQPGILARDAAAVARLETAIRRSDLPGLVCGMCGVEPTVVGLAALAAAGAGPGVALAAATSAERSGRTGRAVGYFAVAFPWEVAER